MREKLIELLTAALCNQSVEEVADHLIANGATVQEWISVKDRLPESGDFVLGYMSFGECRTLKWKTDTQRWEGILLDYSMDFVTRWMPLPHPPKGE